MVVSEFQFKIGWLQSFWSYPLLKKVPGSRLNTVQGIKRGSFTRRQIKRSKVVQETRNELKQMVQD